MNNHVSFGFGS